MTGKYSGIQIALHWGIALGVVANYIISDGMPETFDAMLEGKPVEGWVPSFHVWMGVAVLVMVVLRIAVRFLQGAPEASGEGLAAMAASLGHLALYALMLVVPAFGAIAWFGHTEFTADAHVYAMNALMILALGHAAMSLFHHFVLRDGLLNRMIRT